MNFEFTNSGFVPYESFEYIYKERHMPEFGRVESPFLREINTWKFYLANNEGEIPFGVEASSYDDSDWDIVNTPSTWQTEGYGLPQNLLYNYPEELDKVARRKEESISDKYILHSTGSERDEVGIYRTTIVFTPEDIDRAIYLETSGICGSFSVYLNGQLVTESHSVYTRQRLLLSDCAKVGVNLLVIAVNRWDRDSHGKIMRNVSNYGFSGIFRPLYIVAESLVEISGVKVRLQSAPAAYVNELTETNSEATALSTDTVERVPHGDFMVSMDMRVRNHTDFPVPYSVNVSILEARNDYDPYKLPYVKLANYQVVNNTIDAKQTLDERLDFVALDVATWSDATPVQYDLVIEVKDSSGRTICAKKKRFGFNTTEVYSNKININDRHVPLMLTRYFEFDPMKGISTSVDRMRQDIILMKRCGINGIITEGFPASDELLDLCDQYGIYVVATADKSLMQDYVNSAMTHPSIVLWALNDYGYNSTEYLAVKGACNLNDGRRPWYCAADSDGKVSDLSPMPNEAGVVFGPWEDICLDRASIFKKNKTGKNLFDTISGRTHLADDDADYKWIHHADLVGDKQKADSCIGQGIVDSERNPHPIYLDIKKQCQSINIFSNNEDPLALTMRNVHPFAYSPDMILEWKVMIGGNTVLSGRGSITEIEPYGFRSLRFPNSIEKYMEDGWAEGNSKLLDMYMNALSHEVIFEINLKLAKDTYYANEGYELAFYQVILADECGYPVASDNRSSDKLESGFTVSGLMLEEGEKHQDEVIGQVSAADINLSNEFFSEITGLEDDGLVDFDAEYSITGTPKQLVVGNDNLKISFDRTTGALCQISIYGQDFLKGSLKPSFYRCPSNIDRTDRNFVLAKTIFSKESDYEEIQESLKFVGCNYSNNNGVFTFISRYTSFAMKGEILICYELNSSDKVRVTLNFTPKYDMVRYGFRMPIVNEGLLCRWYGRGPGESYYDRKNATRFGIYAAGADKIYHPYARPAENSSHTDTSAMQLINTENSAVEFRRLTGGKNSKFEFTVLPYTPEQMNEFLHEEQLMQNDFCELFLDFCSKEIERTFDNVTSLPLKKNVAYRETFEIRLKK